jgi:hypothetical protein
MNMFWGQRGTGLCAGFIGLLAIFFWASLPINAYAAGVAVEIKDAHAYLLSNAHHEVQGSISWIAPAHTDANPIMDYRVEISYTDAGTTSTYTQLNCAIDLTNSRCLLAGLLALPQSEKYYCNATNQSFLNSLFSVKVQALSAPARASAAGTNTVGDPGMAHILICDPSLIKSDALPSPNPTPPSPPTPPAPTPPAHSETPSMPSQPTINPHHHESSQPSSTTPPTDSPINTASPAIDTSSSNSTNPSGSGKDRSSAGTGGNIFQRFGRLGLDLDPDTRKRAQRVVVAYLAVAISVTMGRKME